MKQTMQGRAARGEERRVKQEMKERWEVLDANTAPATEDEGGAPKTQPLRFVDKMLNNYYNIGFIHMLFPKALFLIRSVGDHKHTSEENGCQP